MKYDVVGNYGGGGPERWNPGKTIEADSPEFALLLYHDVVINDKEDVEGGISLIWEFTEVLPGLWTYQWGEGEIGVVVQR